MMSRRQALAGAAASTALPTVAGGASLAQLMAPDPDDLGIYVSGCGCACDCCWYLCRKTMHGIRLCRKGQRWCRGRQPFLLIAVSQRLERSHDRDPLPVDIHGMARGCV